LSRLMIGGLSSVGCGRLKVGGAASAISATGSRRANALSRLCAWRAFDAL